MFTLGRKLVIGVLPFAVAATVASAGTASATNLVEQQAEFARGLSSAGVVDGVSYATTVADNLSGVSATVDNARFVAAADGGSIVVQSAQGAAITSIPTSLTTVGGNTIALGTQISGDGRSLSVTPQVSDSAGAELKDIATNPGAQNPDPLINGAAAGAAIGAVVGAILCVPALAAFLVGYIPCAIISVLSNALFGAILGAVVGAVAPDVIPQVLP